MTMMLSENLIQNKNFSFTLIKRQKIFFDSTFFPPWPGRQAMGKVEKESKSKLRFSFWASIQKLLVFLFQIVSSMRLADSDFRLTIYFQSYKSSYNTLTLWRSFSTMGLLGTPQQKEPIEQEPKWQKFDSWYSCFLSQQ